MDYMDSSQDGSEMMEAMEVETMVLVAEAAAEQGAFLDFDLYWFPRPLPWVSAGVR